MFKNASEEPQCLSLLGLIDLVVGLKPYETRSAGLGSRGHRIWYPYPICSNKLHAVRVDAAFEPAAGTKMISKILIMIPIGRLNMTCILHHGSCILVRSIII